MTLSVKSPSKYQNRIYNNSKGNLAQHGYTLRKVEIDVEELLIWCNSQNRPLDGDARSEFTVVKLRESEQERL